ncbi:MAG: histone deacetylase family protein [Deltaproteobacteria bacterium]|nr:histone deacetylase family protein [Deltaproteobacteria bacterium]
MKVVYHDAFRQSYCRDPAAAEGRIDAVVRTIKNRVEFIKATPADHGDIAACHTESHIKYITRKGLYEISSLAAGGALHAAQIGLEEPCFALIRPPGHHASPDFSWGYCFFNNIAIAIAKLKREGKIRRAFVLDIDRHFGDGTFNILGVAGYATIYNPYAPDSDSYLKKIQENLPDDVDIIGISAGFDNHQDDIGGLLSTEDYREIGKMVKEASRKSNSGCFAVLEGGYNHDVLGQNVMALIQGMEGH